MYRFKNAYRIQVDYAVVSRTIMLLTHPLNLTSNMHARLKPMQR
jgi:hypothetical protein